jgi:hypothetical protein
MEEQQNKDRTGEIYVLTCTVNNKKYVGQALHTKLNKGKYITHGMIGRWKDHVWEASSKKYGQCKLLNNAILKYGKDSFKIERLTECKNQLELNIEEQYWIRKLNTIAPNGYNLSFGGTNRHATYITKNKLSYMTKKHYENVENRKQQSKRIEKVNSDKRFLFFKDKKVKNINIKDIKTTTSPPHIRVYIHYTCDNCSQEFVKRTNFHYNGKTREQTLQRVNEFTKSLTTNDLPSPSKSEL